MGSKILFHEFREFLTPGIHEFRTGDQSYNIQNICACSYASHLVFVKGLSSIVTLQRRVLPHSNIIYNITDQTFPPSPRNRLRRISLVRKYKSIVPRKISEHNTLSEVEGSRDLLYEFVLHIIF